MLTEVFAIYINKILKRNTNVGEKGDSDHYC